MSTDASDSKGPGAEGGIVRALEALLHLALPALLTLFCLRFLVPTLGAATGTSAAWLARTVDGHEGAVGIAVFIGFALIGRYWSTEILGMSTTAIAQERGSVKGTAIAASIAAVLALGLRATASSYRIEGTSMLPTLTPDALVAGSKIGYGSLVGTSSGALPARGDLVVFRDPVKHEGSELVVKRVFGLPGDKIEMNGMQPVINGWRVPHCDVGGYLYPLSSGGAVAARLHVEFLDGRAHLALYAPPSRLFTSAYVVKPGEVFVLGDNRVNSVDSRSWGEGIGAGLPLERVEARVKWWLAERSRDEHLDFSRLLKPFELDVRLDGVETGNMGDGIARCLQKTPAQTNPPAPHGS